MKAKTYGSNKPYIPNKKRIDRKNKKTVAKRHR